MRDHRHEDPTVPDGEAFHAYPITYERTSRLNRRAVAVAHRQQVDEGAAAARVDEDDYRRIGDPVAVEVAKGGQVVYQPGVHPLRRAGAERDRSPPPMESNRGLLVVEQRQMVLAIEELFERKTPQFTAGGRPGFLLGVSRRRGRQQADREERGRDSRLQAHGTEPPSRQGGVCGLDSGAMPHTQFRTGYAGPIHGQ